MKPGKPLACKFNALSKVLTTCPWHFRCNPSFPWSLSPSCLSPSFPSFIKHSGESWRVMVSHLLWQTRELIRSSLCAKKALNDHLFPPCMCKQSFSQSDGFTGDRISAEGSYQPQSSVPWLYRFEMNNCTKQMMHNFEWPQNIFSALTRSDYVNLYFQKAVWATYLNQFKR